MIESFILIFFAHWFSDFPLQAWTPLNNVMKHKHKSLLHLWNHMAVYGSSLLFITMWFWLDHGMNLIYWVLANLVLHGCVDYWTSRASNKLWSRGISSKVIREGTIGMHYFESKINYEQKFIGPFWCVIGFDQMIHGICLFTTAKMLGLI